MKVRVNSKSVLIVRLIFALLIALCIILYTYQLTDYAIFIIFLILISGFFTLYSAVLSKEKLKIRKYYFWALISFARNISFQDIKSLSEINYEVETHQESWIFTENLLSLFTIELLKPKVKFTTVLITYTDNNKENKIELRMSRENLKKIDEYMKVYSPYKIFKYSRFKIGGQFN